VQIRLYIDEDAMSRSLLAGLRARGIDVQSVIETERTGLADIDQLEYATQEGRVLCTSNVGDFYRLHTDLLRQGKVHAGIILIQQQQYGVGEQIRRLLRLISTLSTFLFDTHIEK